MEDRWLLEQAERKIELGEYKEAAYLLRKLKSFCHERDKKAYVEKRLGEVYLHLKFLDKARQHFDTSLRLNARDPEGHYFYALSLFLSGRSRRALVFCEKAIALNSQDPENYYLHGLILLGLNKFMLAEINFRRALEFEPEHVASLLELAKTLWRRGECKKSEKLLQKTIQISPDFLPAKELLRKLRASQKGKNRSEKSPVIEGLFDQKMETMGYTEVQRKKARKLWRDFLRRRRLKIRKPEVWAAAVHYAISRLEFHNEESQALLAETYGISKKSISLAFQDICATVRLRLYDRRYSTQIPPFDDWEEL